jgi:O-antigen/teichoic acid export membrane protein
MPVLVLCLSLAGIVAPALALAWARRSLPWIRVRLSELSRGALRELTERSVPIFLFQLGALAVNETQVLILARRSGLAVVTDFAVVMRLYVAVASLIQLGTAAFVPPLREAHERGDGAWARRAFGHLRTLRMALGLAGGLGLLLLGDPFLRLWLGRSDMSFGPRVWGPAVVLLLASVWVTAYVELLWIRDRLWPLVGLVLTNGVVTSAATWWLAPAHGVTGALAASSAFTLLVSAWAVPVLSRPLLRGAAGAGVHSSSIPGGPER